MPWRREGICLEDIWERKNKNTKQFIDREEKNVTEWPTA